MTATVPATLPRVTASFSRGLALLHKLERAYAKGQQDDEDVDAAYHFVATAEHMPAWIKGGGRQGKAFKRAIQQQELILPLVNDLMIGEPTFSSSLR